MALSLAAAALIAGGLSAGSSIAGLASNASQNKKDREFNSAEALLNREFQSEEAQKNREFTSAEALLNRQWQEEMSNTAYQRQVLDMQKAGLNPYLAYGSSGASTPSGSTAQGSMPQGSQGSSHSNRYNMNDLGQVFLSAMALQKKFSPQDITYNIYNEK